MRVKVEIEVKTAYQGRKKINDVNIFVELDEHKNIGYKVDGIRGEDIHYFLGYYYDKAEAIDHFSTIKCQLLAAEETEAENWQ